PAAATRPAAGSVEALGKDGTPIYVRWSLDPRLRGPDAGAGARADAVVILRTVHRVADFSYSRLELIGTYAPDGAPPRKAVEAGFDKPTVDGVDLAALDPRGFFGLAEGKAYLDPDIRG